MGEFLKTVVGIALVLGVIWWLWQGVLGMVGIIAYLLRGGGLTCLVVILLIVFGWNIGLFLLTLCLIGGPLTRMLAEGLLGRGPTGLL